MHLISSVPKVFVYCGIVDCGNHKVYLMRWERADNYLWVWMTLLEEAWHQDPCSVHSSFNFQAFCCWNCAFKLLSFLFSQDQEPTAYNHVSTVVSWGKMEARVDKETSNIQNLGSLAVYKTQRPTSRLHTQWIISRKKRPSGGATDNFAATSWDVTFLSCHLCSGGLVRNASAFNSPTLL